MDNSDALDLIVSYIKDPSVSAWVREASSEDIAAAISVGYTLIHKYTMIPRNVELSPVAPTKTQSAAEEFPVTRGQVGEARIQDMLAKHFGSVTNVTQQTARGDLTLHIQHRKITVEVKNYSNPVPSSGIEKFHRDLSTTNAAGGLFISLKSPIVGITTTFALRFEQSDTKVVPCAYLVSSDEQTIAVAVGIVSQLILSTEYLQTEIYNRDSIVAGVYAIGDRLDDLARVRNDLQISVGDIARGIMKTASSLVSAESAIRCEIDKLRDQLFESASSENIVHILASHSAFIKYSAPMRASIIDILQIVENMAVRLLAQCPWKISGRRCMHISGMGFNLLASRAEVILPRTRISSEAMITALNIFGKKVSIDECLHIVLDDLTSQWICDQLRGYYKPSISVDTKNDVDTTLVDKKSDVVSAQEADVLAKNKDKECAISSAPIVKVINKRSVARKTTVSKTSESQ